MTKKKIEVEIDPNQTMLGTIKQLAPKTKRDWGQIAAIVSIIGSLTVAAFFIQGYFAKEADVRAMRQQGLVREWTFESTQNELRMDIIEERIDREISKPKEEQKARRIRSWEGQVDTLTSRNAVLKHNIEQITIANITQ